MKKTLRHLPMILIVSIAVAFSGCSKSSSNTDPGTGNNTGNNNGAGSLTTTMSISGFTFAPATLTVKSGTVIKITNNDTAPHTVTADNNNFNSGNIPGNGGTATITPTTVGTFPFHCAYHSSMVGTLTVSN
ncbi:MAG: cupredoxin domain-containing protein [Candidatus Dadabacteria bacterium]